jgi:hypothetical protein
VLRPRHVIVAGRGYLGGGWRFSLAQSAGVLKAFSDFDQVADGMIEGAKLRTETGQSELGKNGATLVCAVSAEAECASAVQWRKVAVMKFLFRNRIVKISWM